MDGREEEKEVGDLMIAGKIPSGDCFVTKENNNRYSLHGSRRKEQRVAEKTGD